MRGHIRERSPGRWAIVIDARDPQTGERKRRWHSFAGTKRQAQVRCAELIAQLRDGAAVDPSRITLRQLLNRFEADWVVHHTSARTAVTQLARPRAASSRRTAATGSSIC
jgi:hypothetical protein